VIQENKRKIIESRKSRDVREGEKKTGAERAENKIRTA